MAAQCNLQQLGPTWQLETIIRIRTITGESMVACGGRYLDTRGRGRDFCTQTKGHSIGVDDI